MSGNCFPQALCLGSNDLHDPSPLLEKWATIFCFHLISKNGEYEQTIKRSVMIKANFGVVGMAVMGRNPCLIISISLFCYIYNRSKEKKTEDVVACHPEKNFVQAMISSFVKLYRKTTPHIMLMVFKQDLVQMQPSSPSSTFG